MNAYILDWTMNDYKVLKKKLDDQEFVSENETGTKHIRVSVPFDQIDTFASIVQQHLNAPCNYVDVQFQDKKTTVVIFIEKVFFIKDADKNNEVKKWAIEKGLPPKQADWNPLFG